MTQRSSWRPRNHQPTPYLMMVLWCKGLITSSQPPYLMMVLWCKAPHNVLTTSNQYLIWWWSYDARGLITSSQPASNTLSDDGRMMQGGSWRPHNQQTIPYLMMVLWCKGAHNVLTTSNQYLIWWFPYDASGLITSSQPATNTLSDDGLMIQGTS